MNDNPLVSVIIPCYNCERYVQQAVDSIINQTYSNLEILLADDGSNDGTNAILKRIAITDSRIKVIENESNLGIVETLNKLVKLSNGNYIARMDADDFSFPQRIEREVSLLENNPDVGICGCDAFIINENGKIVDKMIMPHSSKEIDAFKQVDSPFIHPNILIRSHIIKSLLYRKEYQSAEDYELWLRVLEKTHGENIQSPLFCYRILPTSISHASTTRLQQQKLKHKLQVITRESYNKIILDRELSFTTKLLVTRQSTKKNVFLLITYYCMRVINKMICLKGKYI